MDTTATSPSRIRRMWRRVRWGADLTVEIRAHSGETYWVLRSWKHYQTPDGRRRLNTPVASGSVDLPATDTAHGNRPVADHEDAARWVREMLHREYGLHAGPTSLAVPAGVTWGHYGMVQAKVVWA
jgi:hypothetical protein